AKSRDPWKDVEDPKSSSSDETSSDSDDESSSESRASDSKSDSERKSTAQPAEAPTPIELNMSSSPAREQTRPKQDSKTSAELDDEIAGLRAQIVAREREQARLVAESSSERTPTPPPKPSRATPVPAPKSSRATPAPKSSNRRSRSKAPVKAPVQVEESVVVEEEEGLNGDTEEVDGGAEAEEKEKVAKLTQQVLDRATGRHVLDVMKTLTGAAHTKDAKPPLFDAEKRPVYRSDDLIRPQWDLPFEENMKAWGTDFDNAVMDHSRIKGAHADHIRSLTSEQFRKILQRGTFATMVRSWKQAKEGKLDEWSNARKIAGRVANRKKGKAKIRKAGLEASGLDRDKFGHLADTDYQSSEYSDAVDPNHLVIKDCEFEDEKTKSLSASLYRQGTSGKKKTAANAKKRFSHIKVNAKVPELDHGKRVPGWGINKQWIKDNVELELDLRPRIDHDQDTMPQTDAVDRFIKSYPPQPKT
ncbi:hypothetical protein FRC07_013476, partial [Ceratobasidium sp. 392]